MQGTGLTLRNCYIHDCDDGVLNGGGDVLFENCEFDHNGFGDGYSHNIYIGAGTNSLTMRYCFSHNTVEGHEIKTRANNNYILYNLVVTEGTGSREIQFAQGGNCYAIGNVVVKGSNAHNNEMIVFGGEGTNANPNLYVVNNTLINYRGSASGVVVNNPPNIAVMQNNIMQSVPTVTNGSYAGSITATSNWITTNAHLVNPSIDDLTTFDARLTADSLGAINAGTAPGTGYNNYSLMPVEQYLDPCSSEARLDLGTIDIGAYEYVPGFNTAPAVDAGADQLITLPASADLTGTATDDGLPDPPNALTFTWSRISGPAAVAFGNANALTTTATFSAAGTYVLQLTADDGEFAASDTMTVTVEEPPTVHIDPARDFVYEGETISLHATALDPNGNTLTYAWGQTAGKQCTVGDPTAPTTSVTIPIISDQAEGAMNLSVTVANGHGGTAADAISFQTYMAGDINHDNQTNVGDLQALAEAWGTTGQSPVDSNWNPWADVNGDGYVNVADLQTLINNWNRVCP